jgi:hypothetical protein
MKKLTFNIRTYTNFCILCKIKKINHDFLVSHGKIVVIGDSQKLEELGY